MRYDAKVGGWQKRPSESKNNAFRTENERGFENVGGRLKREKKKKILLIAFCIGDVQISSIYFFLHNSFSVSIIYKDNSNRFIIIIIIIIIIITASLLSLILFILLMGYNDVVMAI